MHSWGTIFIQDVVMPLRKKPLTPAQHINLLRGSILGVAVFIFLFSLFYRQNAYLLMFMVFTGTIYLGGAGAAFIGGLYWSRGTTAGAWSALILGLVWQIVQRIWPNFPLNSNWIFAIAMVSCSTLYVIVSLLGGKKMDMDQLLHRGKYAIAVVSIKDEAPVMGFKALIAMGPEFTLWDKFVYLSTIGWTLLLCAVFIVGTAMNFIFKLDTGDWTKFWRVYIDIMFVLTVITTIWFIVGGIRDYRKMFRLLKSRKADDRDDGRVLDHVAQNTLQTVRQKVASEMD
jgi:SSS family solute:Na+ symporter